jgi:peptidoglycan/LPS O-acetylase OafA/YrhL
MLLVILCMVVILRALAAREGYVSIYDEPWHPVVTWQSFIANLFLVQAWNVFPYLSWNGASWFVSVEFLLCLMVPAYFTAARGGLRAAVLLVAGGAGGLALLALTPKTGLDLTYHNGIFRGMAAFAIGVGLAVLRGRILDRGGAALPEFAHSVLQLALLALLLAAIYGTGWAHRPADILTVLPMVPLILALSFDRGILARALATRVPLRLGEWSYAIYLGQTALEQLLRHIKVHVYPAPASVLFGRSWAAWEPVRHWIEPAVLVTGAILWGWLLFTLVERPAASWLRRTARA